MYKERLHNKIKRNFEGVNLLFDVFTNSFFFA